MSSSAASHQTESESAQPQAAPKGSPQTAAAPTGLAAATLLQLQRHAGNRAVARLLAGSPAGLTGLAAPSARPLQRSSSSSSGSSGGGSSSSGSSGGGGQAPPAPAPTGTSNPALCQVDVRATHIGGFLSGAPVWHLYIVHTDDFGTQTGWRGGPGGGSGGGFGSIIGTTGAYAPGFIDWDPGAPSVTVGAGTAVCGKTTCFASELARIDATSTPYDPTGPNSNTWVKTVLDNCGLPKRKPVWIAPGFGDPNL